MAVISDITTDERLYRPRAHDASRVYAMSCTDNVACHVYPRHIVLYATQPYTHGIVGVLHLWPDSQDAACKATS